MKHWPTVKQVLLFLVMLLAFQASFSRNILNLQSAASSFDCFEAGGVDAVLRSMDRAVQAIHREFEVTTQRVLAVKGCARLLDSEPTLQRSIRLRNPYVDPIHLMQVDLLRRWRESGRQDAETFDKTKSENARAEFENYCAFCRKEWSRYQHKTRVVAYGGI